MNQLPHVVIIGGGFAGLNAAKALKNSACRITLIDRKNHHLFQPLLYQVATGGLSPADISAPIRALLKSQKNVSVLMDNVTGFNVENRQVFMGSESLSYDHLIIATGANHAYFGQDAWAKDAPGLKTLQDATAIRHKILLAFEKAETVSSDSDREAWQNFVIVGAGPTGVELAGALAELARHTLKEDFRKFNPGLANIYLVDAGPSVLPAFEANTSQKAQNALEKLGVTVRPNCRVSSITEDGVHLETDEGSEFIPSKTVLWAAGVKASRLGEHIARETSAATDRAGRVAVSEDFSIPGHSNIYVVGDLATYSHHGGSPLPGTAAVAQQAGSFVGRSIGQRLKGKSPKPFKYTHYGDLAVIGRSAAVADVGRLRLSGNPAWWFWLLVHLMKLVDIQNRVTVFMQWAWSYFTRKSSARLITLDADSLRTSPPKKEPIESDGTNDPVSNREVQKEKGRADIRLIA